eukprot:gnl/Dysnectes_brevis/946_a1053_6710.p1 GENE.gnl/Dysnectes_brevis/946_a1053_6710~~gnl/Dysnectes_brevis/946_a1053_6710.p1  ORF type:complete len:258 (-),score=58.30 gnl/Dysnectes_brevis/946_a1053_6710:53-826(-)
MFKLLLLAVLLALVFADDYDDLYGSDFRYALKRDWHDGKYDSLGYHDARVEMYGYIYNSEETNGVEGVYSGLFLDFPYGCEDTGYNADLNCEHLVPQSFFGKKEPMKSDMHHLRPSYMPDNSARSNYGFKLLEVSEIQKYYNQRTITTSRPSDPENWSKLKKSTAWEPRDQVKGNVARAVLYFFSVYPDYIDKLRDTVDSMDDTVNWNDEFLPTDDQLAYHEGIADAQGNRNFFVDHPEWARRAWCDYLEDGCAAYM